MTVAGQVKRQGEADLTRPEAIRRLVEIGLKAKGEMGNASQLPRFVVRKGVDRNTWMVWDRQISGPAKLTHGPAVRLSQEAARLLRDKLEKQRRRD